VNPEAPKEVVLDKGYHSNEVLAELADWPVRSYCSEPDRGRRRWEGKKTEEAAVYANRRRIRGERGKRLLRQGGGETGGMRRVYLRRHPTILKRLLVHVAAVNWGLVRRKVMGHGTPRGLQGYNVALYLTFLRLLHKVGAPPLAWNTCANSLKPLPAPVPSALPTAFRLELLFGRRGGIFPGFGLRLGESAK
jgi:hypothetical protein